MKIAPFFFIVVFIWAGCATQETIDDPAGTHFIKFYGHDGDQEGRDLVVMPDGSMVLFGTTRPTQALDGLQWLVTRVDVKGAVIWEKEYGQQFDEEARDIELMTSGDLVLVGNSYQGDGLRDVWVMTISASDGSTLSAALIQVGDVDQPAPYPPSVGDEEAFTITQISDGGFIIAGTTTYTFSAPAPGPADTHDAFILRLNPDLSKNSNWTELSSEIADEGFIKAIETPPGASATNFFYALGYSNVSTTSGGYDYWVQSFGATGVQTLGEYYKGGAGNEKMSSFAFTGSQLVMNGLQTTTSSDFYILSSFLPTDTVIFQFEKTLALNLGTNLGGHTAICPAPVNGGFYILGEENGFNNNQNWILSRLNNDGTTAMSAPIVFGGEGFDSAGAIKELPDGRVVIIGTMRTGRPDAGEYKMTLIKVNGEGKFEK